MQYKAFLPLFITLQTIHLSASPTNSQQSAIKDIGFTNPHQIVIGDDGKSFIAIRKALTEAHIIDDVVDDFLPKCYVTPYYSKGKTVTLGNTIKPKKTKDRPGLEVYCPDVQETTGLTIVLTDPDAPSKENPKWGEMCHWIATTTVVSPESVFELGEEVRDIVRYKPPGPPPKTGKHRYIFLLLEGVNTNLTVPAKRQHWGTGRKGHGVRDWAEQEGLQVIGANFFYAKNKKQ